MAVVTVNGASRLYAGGHAGVRATDLTIEHGELLVLVGPSGCGKSTLLRMIAGLEPLTAGRIAIGGTDVTHLPPQERDVAMVFQSYALYPHMTVRQNLAYALRVRRMPRGAVAERVERVAAALGLTPLLDRRPLQLSGGQRQRVALGRALVREPQAFLLDEPLSNLDPALRLQARAELLRLHREIGATMIYVTHDQEEAMTLGTRVAVMHDGRIVQVAAPLEVYARPADTFVARFIGSPPMNLFETALPGVDAGDAIIGIRPHDVRFDEGGPMAATVDVVERRGPDAIVHVRLDDGRTAVVVAADAPPSGARVRLGLPNERLHRFDRTTGRRLA